MVIVSNRVRVSKLQGSNYNPNNNPKIALNLHTKLTPNLPDPKNSLNITLTLTVTLNLSQTLIITLKTHHTK